MTDTEEMPEEVENAPKTSKESILRVLGVIGLQCLLDDDQKENLDLNETTDLVALYRIVCMADLQEKVRDYFEVSPEIEKETLDYIERQYEDLN